MMYCTEDMTWADERVTEGDTEGDADGALLAALEVMTLMKETLLKTLNHPLQKAVRK